VTNRPKIHGQGGRGGVPVFRPTRRQDCKNHKKRNFGNFGTRTGKKRPKWEYLTLTRKKAMTQQNFARGTLTNSRQKSTQKKKRKNWIK